MNKRPSTFYALVCALSLAALPLAASAEQAQPAAAKPVKQVSCKQEAKNAGIKGRSEVRKYVKECKQKRSGGKTSKAR